MSISDTSNNHAFGFLVTDKDGSGVIIDPWAGVRKEYQNITPDNINQLIKDIPEYASYFKSVRESIVQYSTMAIRLGVAQLNHLNEGEIAHEFLTNLGKAYEGTPIKIRRKDGNLVLTSAEGVDYPVVPDTRDNFLGQFKVHYGERFDSDGSARESDSPDSLRNVDRRDLPVSDEPKAGMDRRDLPVSDEPKAGMDRRDLPVSDEPKAGMDRHGLPLTDFELGARKETIPLSSEDSVGIDRHGLPLTDFELGARKETIPLSSEDSVGIDRHDLPLTDFELGARKETITLFSEDSTGIDRHDLPLTENAPINDDGNFYGPVENPRGDVSSRRPDMENTDNTVPDTDVDPAQHRNTAVDEYDLPKLTEAQLANFS